MKKNNSITKRIITIVIILAVIACIIFFVRKGKTPNIPIEEAKAEIGTIVNSVSSDGVIEPVTNVEIKSNIGGTIIKLYADEGDYVHAGQLLAQIDPVDVLTTLEKEKNNVVSANAKLSSARESLEIQKTQAVAELNSAKENVRSAEIKLASAKKQAKVQPNLSTHEIETAKANLTQAKETLAQMKNATSNQKLTSAKASFESAEATFNSAEKTYERNKSLLSKGYLSKKDYEADEQKYISAKATLAEAREKYNTIKTEIDSEIKVQEEKVRSSEIALNNAKTNSYNIEIKNNDVASAQSALRSAKESLKAAQANLKQIQVKESSVIQAESDLSSAKSSLKNAEKNYNYTNITAPRDGVIVKKWTEEGSIIMAGRSSTAGSKEGVDIFELADTTKMQISVDVDETDINSIHLNQFVKISVDAFPNKEFTGTVTRICPSAETNSGVTTVPVEVTFNGVHKELKPEMNATCEFIIDTKENILTLPVDYVNITGDRASVFVADPKEKFKMIPIKIGIIGEEAVEITEGLKEGDKVVNPKIAMMMKGDMPKGGRGGNRSNMQRGNQKRPKIGGRF